MYHLAMREPSTKGTSEQRCWLGGMFRGGLLVSLLLLSSVLLASACGGDDPLTQPQARDRGAGAVCDQQARCGQIGAPPARYLTRDQCLTMVKGFVETFIWPAADCMHIVRAEYDMCIGSIQNLSCSDGLDTLNSLSKCSKANVCGTP